jgi:2-polyprenyl-3-methyl-5-hydroxy-6-metoxy-1,4-benzoquinol methylase
MGAAAAGPVTLRSLFIEATMIHNCDLCGSADAVEVPHAREYTNNQPIHICCGCGFVYVRERRSAEEIAATWANTLFGPAYTARAPYAKARQIFVAEILDIELGLSGKKLCDVGAGEGQFIEIIQAPPYNAQAFGVEPSTKNCRAMTAAGISCFDGTAEGAAAVQELRGQFDIVTTMWTIENCSSCIDLVNAASSLLKPGGHFCVATGSRILVPFKKPLHRYLSTNPADTHCFRWSANTLRGLLMKCGFEIVFTNSYIDNDVLCMIGRKIGKPDMSWPRDDWWAVANFFERWHTETDTYYPREK